MNIPEHCLTKSAEQTLVAGSLVCRSNAEAKAAALKAAAVYLMIAGWAESMDAQALADRCMAASDDYLRSAKPYAKRATSPERAAYVKGAAVLREIAEMARKPQPRRRTRTAQEVIGDPRDSVVLKASPEPQFPPAELYNVGGGYIGHEGE
jgi:hypothetical protein